MIRKSMKRTKKIPNNILAIPAAAPAIPPNPRAAAIMEMTKKAAAQYSIDAPFRQKYSSQHLGSAAVVWQVSGSYLLIWEARIEFLRAKRRWRCNAEASRRYLLEGRALDPKRQRLLLILPGLELRGPGRAVAAAAF
jgi:hypothetical protein